MKARGPVSGESRSLFGAGKLFLFAVFAFKIKVSPNDFENVTMKLSVNEAKLTGLWAGNCATIQKVLILKFALFNSPFTSYLAVRKTGPQAALY